LSALGCLLSANSESGYRLEVGSAAGFQGGRSSFGNSF